MMVGSSLRLFQNNGLSRGFVSQARSIPQDTTFASRIECFLQTRVSASHILQPVLNEESNAFYANGDDAALQRLWATENGIKTDDLSAILRAQIEHHRTEIFYNLDPMKYGSAFARSLPGCVRKTICWRAAPSGNVDLSGYDLVVGNFKGILNDWQSKGCRVAYFVPGHDPELNPYADQRHEELDLVFVGGFSRHHSRRSAVLQAAALTSNISARFHLEDGRLTRVANAAPWLIGFKRHAHPPEIRAVRSGPVYGQDLYKALSGARIVLNGAIDMAGRDRGNMRCFEATGASSLLLSDSGNYPPGFVDGETMLTYSSPREIPAIIQRILRDPERLKAIGRAGHEMVKEIYSKANQWRLFQELCG